MEKFFKNPRLWSEAEKQKLKDNLIELGDISGVVHDLNSNEIPCGNFRSSIIDINSCEIEIVKQLSEPDKQGTIALGFIIWNEQRLNYRQVKWSKDQCERACITANSLGGEWDFESLMSDDWDLDLLKEWNIDIPEQDYSFIDNLQDNSFRDEINNSVQFQITFVFNKTYKDSFDTYLKENSKQELQEEIIKIITNA